MIETLLPLMTLQKQLFRYITSAGILAPGLILGAFIPLKVQGQLCETCFAIENRPDQDGCVTRPSTWLTVDSATGKLLFFSDCAVHDFVDPALYPPDSRVLITGDTFRRAPEAGTELLKAYEDVRSFAFSAPCNDKQRHSARDLAGLFMHAFPPDLIPYYHALSPDFFQWLEKMS